MRSLVRGLGSSTTFCVMSGMFSLSIFCRATGVLSFFLVYHDFHGTESWLKTLSVSILTKKRKPKSIVGVRARLLPLINFQL